jgi:glycosyltransferase involved in cell wall biosynthesis
LLVGYIGGFTRNRLLLPLVAALKDQPGLHLLLAGDGPQRPALQSAIAGAGNITDLGWIPAGQVPLITRLADVLYYGLVPDYPGAIYNAPNSLANALAAGRPLIANPVGDLGRIVAETGCGLLIEPVTPETIQAAVQRLADPALRAQLGAAGRRAAETSYHWGQAAGDLLRFYAQL